MKYFLFTLGQQQRGVARLGHSTHRAPGTVRSRNSTLVDTLDNNDTYCVYAMIKRIAPKDNIFLTLVTLSASESPVPPTTTMPRLPAADLATAHPCCRLHRNSVTS